MGNSLPHFHSSHSDSAFSASGTCLAVEWGWMVGWMAECLDGWVDGCVDSWMDGGMIGWVDGWVDGWMVGRMARWMAGPPSCLPGLLILGSRAALQKGESKNSNAS